MRGGGVKGIISVKKIAELFVYLLVRVLFRGLEKLPHRVRVGFFSTLFRLAFFLIPRIRSTIDRNLTLAFPDESARWRKEMLRKNATEMGRLLADTVRLRSLSAEWVAGHVAIPVLETYRSRLKEDPSRGILIATGHLGSFELLGHAMGLRGLPLAAVARKFRSKLFDRWWTGLREASGNRIIDRRGAFKEIVATISSGMSTAVLFDQNVTRNHAVFVTWFGLTAATTKSLALAALRTEAPLYVASIRYEGDDSYTVDGVECPCSDLYHDTALSTEMKVQIITQRLADIYCEMIRKFPEGWFWLHRRWKTRPEASEPSIYR